MRDPYPRTIIRDNHVVTGGGRYGIRVQHPPKPPAILRFLRSRRTRDVLLLCASVAAAVSVAWRCLA